jgi:flagellar hook-associated protein 1 FlgK
MSLIGALNIGKTALAVTQAQIQSTGNNIANAADPNYSRQVSVVSPNRDQQLKPGMFVGTGLNLTDIQRQVDEALQARLRGSTSDQQAADITQQWMSRVEATFNELSDQDLSTQLSTFFNSWSDLANKPQDVGLRQIVVQNGQGLASSMQHLRSQLSDLQNDANSRLKTVATDANNLAQQIANMNREIVKTEGSAGVANGLRDQRDALLGKLSELVDIKSVPQANGVVNVYVGSEPLIMETTNLGIATRDDQTGGANVTSLIFKTNNGTMSVKSGQLGALSAAKQQIDGVANQIDNVAGNLIFELNKLHASGQGLQGQSTFSGTNTVDDPAVPLNNALSALKFPPKNGSFVIHVKNKTTGLATSTLVKVDLDGQNANDTTLNSLVADLNGVSGVTASVNAGKLIVSASNGDSEISFSQDSSGALASLGVNSFFSGNTARDIAVNQTIVDQPSLLSAAKNGEKGDNQTAVAIASLETQAISALSGTNLKDSYQAIVNGVATQSASAKNNAEAATVVQQTLQAQRESLSGVSLDEEAVNLMKQQRAYQGAARLVSAVNDMMTEMMNILR